MLMSGKNVVLINKLRRCRTPKQCNITSNHWCFWQIRFDIYSNIHNKHNIRRVQCYAALVHLFPRLSFHFDHFFCYFNISLECPEIRNIETKSEVVEKDSVKISNIRKENAHSTNRVQTMINLRSSNTSSVINKVKKFYEDRRTLNWIRPKICKYLRAHRTRTR